MGSESSILKKQFDNAKLEVELLREIVSRVAPDELTAMKKKLAETTHSSFTLKKVSSMKVPQVHVS